MIMETTSTLLDHLLPEETLNNLIGSCTSLQTLGALVEIKHRRIKQGSCEKLNFSIDCIYNSVTDTDLSVQILKTTLQVAQNCHTHISKTINFCLENLHSSCNNQVYYCLNLFNTVLEYYLSENTRLILPENDFDQFQDGIVRILNGSSKRLITYILMCIIPNASNATDDKLLTQIFNNNVVKEKKLEIVCVCYNNFVKADVNVNDFNLIKSEHFWFLLMDCLTQHHYLKKQATYLLSKCVEIVVTIPNSSLLPKFVKANHLEKSWRNYLLLLDMSNEKQLHIVEPSLCLFASIMNLDFLWRSCLYKIFLNHSQNTIVYNTAIFILQNETEWQHVSKIITEVLRAVNKNEYNVDSNKVFKQLAVFSSKLQNDQFEFFLSQSLTIAWIPAAIWCFYNNIFDDQNRFQLSLSLLDDIIKNRKLIPHKLIRNAYTKLVIYFFTTSYRVVSVDNLLKASSIIRSFDDITFKNFIKDKEDEIIPFEDELSARLLNCEIAQDFKIFSEIMQLLKMQTMILNQIESEEQILNNLGLIENSGQVMAFLNLWEKHSSQKLLDKASDILDSDEFNNAQKIIAFVILYRNHKIGSVIDFWHKFDNSDEEITRIFVEILLKSLDGENVQECITILDKVLESQNTARITIFENVSNVLKNIEITLQFIERCFDEFINLIKTCGSCKTTSQKFISQIFQTDLLENEEFCGKILVFSQKLLEISNGTNSIACILSGSIANVVEGSPQQSAIFIPVIVDLILHGIIVNKTERVEYHVCQEIRRRWPTENNPNADQMTTRLLALDSMLILIKNCSSNDIINKFVSLLTQKYMKYFSKRYFPDSQVHLEKLRILQALTLIITHNSENWALVESIIESFLVETHQPSVKILLQFLLTLLVGKDRKNLITTLCEKLKTIDNNRTSTVTGLIPVLYYLIASQDESEWDQLVEILLPYTMGAQFKLRIYSQVALDKMYRKAIDLKHSRFLEKYKYLHNSLADVIEATLQASCDVSRIRREFFDFSLENCDCSTILYRIPKNHNVTEIEWENLSTIGIGLKLITFNHTDDISNINIQKVPIQLQYNEHIQKKITPWKELLTENCTNDFILVTSLIEKAANLGGLSRTCEVFGIKKMVMRTSKITSDKEFQSLSMSSESWIDVTEVKQDNLREFIVDVKRRGFIVVGAEQTSDSVTLDRFRFPEKTVLILGNEKKGIPADIIPLLDQCIEIPQFGMVRSLNVHVAGAIVMWEYCKQQKL